MYHHTYRNNFQENIMALRRSLAEHSLWLPAGASRSILKVHTKMSAKKLIKVPRISGVTANIRCVTTSSTCPCIDVDKCISICTEEHYTPSCVDADPLGSCVDPLPENPKTTACCKEVTTCRLVGDLVTAKYCVTVKKIQDRLEFYHSAVVLHNTTDALISISALTFKVQQGSVAPEDDNDCKNISEWTDIDNSTTTTTLSSPVQIPANGEKTVSINGSFDIPNNFSCADGSRDYFRLSLTDPANSYSSCFQCSAQCPPDLTFCLKDVVESDNESDSESDSESDDTKVDAESHDSWIVTESELDVADRRYHYDKTYGGQRHKCKTSTIVNTASLYQLARDGKCEDIEPEAEPLDSASSKLTINCTTPTLTASSLRNCEINDSYCVCKTSNIVPPSGCVQTAAYWASNGPENCSGDAKNWPLFTGPWACGSGGLLLGSVCTTRERLCQILLEGNEDAIIVLGQELIAAKFNVLSGAPVPPLVEEAIVKADEILDGLNTGSIDSVTLTLSNYNAGNFPEAPSCSSSVCLSPLIVYDVSTTRTRSETCTVNLNVDVCVGCLSYSKVFTVEVKSSEGFIESASRTFSLGPSPVGEPACINFQYSFTEREVPSNDTTLTVYLRWTRQNYNLSLCSLEDRGPAQGESLPPLVVNINPGTVTPTTATLTDVLTSTCVNTDECAHCSVIPLIPNFGQLPAPLDPVSGEAYTSSCNEFILSNTAINGVHLSSDNIDTFEDLLGGGLNLVDELFTNNNNLTISFVVYADSCVCSVTNTATVEYSQSSSGGTASNSVTDSLRDCGAVTVTHEKADNKEKAKDETPKEKAKDATKGKEKEKDTTKGKEKEKAKASESKNSVVHVQKRIRSTFTPVSRKIEILKKTNQSISSVDAIKSTLVDESKKQPAVVKDEPNKETAVVNEEPKKQTAVVNDEPKKQNNSVAATKPGCSACAASRKRMEEARKLAEKKQ